MQEVQKISCSNSAALEITFCVEYLDPSTGEIIVVYEYFIPVGQQETVDLDPLNIPDGSFVRARVYLVAPPIDKAGDKFVTYRRGGGGVATYNITAQMVPCIVFWVTLVE